MFNNMEIRNDQRQKCFLEGQWFTEGIITVEYLLDDNGQVTIFLFFIPNIRYKIHIPSLLPTKTTTIFIFLLFFYYLQLDYQIFTTVPSHLLRKAKTKKFRHEMGNNEDLRSFRLMKM